MASTSDSDQRLEQTVGNLLRAGVSAAAVVVLIGAVVYLAQNWRGTPDYASFHVGPDALNSFGGTFRGILALDGRALIQGGLLLLLATPIARVMLALVAFAVQRDWRYTFVTAVVLSILFYGLIHGYLDPNAGS